MHPLHAALSRFLREVDGASMRHLRTAARPAKAAGLNDKTPVDDSAKVKLSESTQTAPASGFHGGHGDDSKLIGGKNEPDEGDVHDSVLRNADGDIDDPVALMLKRLGPREKSPAAELELGSSHHRYGKPKAALPSKAPTKTTPRRK